MSEWLEKIHKSQDMIFAQISRLTMLSNAFYQIGNDKVGDKLYNIIERIQDGMKDIDEAIKESLDEQWKQAQDNSANVLNAVMAGIKLKEEESKK